MDNIVLIILCIPYTLCGLAPQFRELEVLHQKYRDKGRVLIGFPYNQFQNQEPEFDETMDHDMVGVLPGGH